MVSGGTGSAAQTGSDVSFQVAHLVPTAGFDLFLQNVHHAVTMSFAALASLQWEAGSGKDAEVVVVFRFNSSCDTIRQHH